MNITHIIEATATGTLTMAAILANSQVRQGHKVRIIYSRRKETPENFRNLFEDVSFENIQMETLSQKAFSLVRIRRDIKETNPQVIIMHSSFAGFIGRIACINIAKEASLYYIPHCISLMRRDIRSLSRMLFLTLEWVASMRRAKFVACSQSELSIINKFIPWAHTRLIENAIEQSSPATNLTSIPQATSNFLIVNVGGIRAQKNPVRFSEIALLLAAAKISAKFLWVGDGDKILRNQLEIAGVDVLGWKSKKDTIAIVSQCDIFLSTSDWEGLPVAILEAMACKVPVIASNCSGNLDVIENEKTGLLFEDPEEASLLIQFLLENTEKAKLLAEQAFVCSSERFSINRYETQFEDMIKGDLYS